MTVIKNLLLALLNATIMLLIILAVAGIVLVGRVEYLADVVHDELTAPMDQLTRIADSIDGIEAELVEPGGMADAAALATDIVLLRQELAAVNANLTALGDITAEGLVTEIGRELSARLAPEPTAAR